MRLVKNDFLALILQLALYSYVIVITVVYLYTLVTKPIRYVG